MMNHNVTAETEVQNCTVVIYKSESGSTEAKERATYLKLLSELQIMI